jgi:hypothetical protein
MRLNPKIQDALQAIETARAGFVAVLREVGNQIEAGTRTKRKHSKARRTPKPVAKKKLA